MRHGIYFWALALARRAAAILVGLTADTAAFTADDADATADGYDGT